jgi:hypothetical protein
MKIICLLIFLLTNHYLIQAQNSTLAVFKNGTTFFVKKQKVDASSGKWKMKEIPQATFGTLWFSAQSNEIKSISSFQEEITEKQKAENIFCILKANIGKRAIINVVLAGDEKVYEGTIEEVRNTLVIFKVANQWLSIESASIKSLSLFEKPASEYESKEKKRIIQLEFAKANKEQNIEMMYLQKGISWVPSYAIDLVSDTKAKLTLRATLMNDVEDIQNANLNFVVGVPNFAYSYLQSPLTSNESVVNFINTLNQNSNSNPSFNRRSDNIVSQSLANYAQIEAPEEEIVFKGMEGQDAEDLYFYTLANVSLPKGGRAFYDILQAEIDYQHIYEVELKGNNENSYYGKDFTQEEKPNSVFHSIRLKNDSKMPWTTGTALITKMVNNQSSPLSQDKLNYIPVGGKGKLKITIAPNISAKHSERELNRVENQKKKDGYMYDLVTVEGKIELKNYKDKTVKLNILRRIIGEAQKSSEKWEAKKLFDFYSGVNAFTQAEWDIDLNAGQSKEITYEYKIYVRR